MQVTYNIRANEKMHIVNDISTITTLKTASNDTQCKCPTPNCTILSWNWIAEVIPENVANNIQFIYVIWLKKQVCKTEPVLRQMMYIPPAMLQLILLHCLLAAQS